MKLRRAPDAVALEPGDGLAQRILELAREPELRDRYQLRRALGRGAMGVVLEAEQLATGRRVAVKFMLRLDDPVALSRLEREGRALARVAHPGLTRVLDAGTVCGYPYLVTELMTGESLADRIRERGRLTLAEVLTIAREVLPALAACHDAGVVHRDVKPGNLLFDAEGRARLADLGMAGWQTAERLTQTGQVIGTPLYVAPELLGGPTATPAADVYSMGCTLHEALAGTPPFDAPSIPALLVAHRDRPPPALHELVPSLPPAVSAAVARMLAKSPAVRPDVRTALAQLEQAAAERARGPAPLRPRTTGRGRAAPDASGPSPAGVETAPPVASPGVPDARGAPPAADSRADHSRATTAAAADTARDDSARAAPSAAVSASRGNPPRGGRLHPALLAVLAVGALAVIAAAVLAPRARPAAPSPAGSGAASPGAEGVPASASASAPLTGAIVALGDARGPHEPAARGRIGSFWPVHPHLVAVAAHPDGRRLATASANSVMAWDAQARRLLGIWRPGLIEVLEAAPGPGASEVAIALHDNSPLRPRETVPNPPADAVPLDFVVWDHETHISRSVEGPGYAGRFAIAPGARRAVCFDALAQKLVVVPLERGVERTDLGSSPAPLAIAASADAARVALAFADRAELRDAGRPPRPVPLPAASTAATAPASWTAPVVALSADGAVLALAAHGTLAVFDAGTGARRAAVAAPAQALALAPDGRRLARVAGPELVVHDAQTLAVLERHPAPIAVRRPLAVTFSGVLEATERGFTLTGDPPAPPPPRCVAVDPDARFAVLALPDGTFATWDAQSGRETPLDPGPGHWTVEALSRDGGTVDFRRSASDGDLVVAVATATGARAPALPVSSGAHVIPLSGGRQLVVAPDLGVELFEGGRLARRLDASAGPTPESKRSRQMELVDRAERRVALSRAGRGMLVLDLLANEKRSVWSPTEVEGEARAGAFLDIPRDILIGTGDGVLHRLSLGQRQPRASLGPTQDGLTVLAASPDGRTAVAGHSDGSVVLWDLARGRPRALCNRHGLEVRAVGLGAGIALSTDETGVLTVWDLAK